MGTERWAYPDYQSLREADIGMAITGWTRESSQFGGQTPDEKSAPRVATPWSANYFSASACAGARTGI